jgi:soluble lytic murein transglycosylase
VLVEAVRTARWAEVRTAAAALPRPLPPAVALAAARAARELGEPRQALELLRSALPGAGELAAALRLEAGRTAGALGQDPWPWVSPLLGRAAPTAQRRAAAAVLRAAWETLPLPALGRIPRAVLPRALRRDLTAVLAVRAADQAAALRLLAERSGDPAALRAAAWLATRGDLAPGERLTVAEALLAGGAWREAAELLARTAAPAAPLRSRWAFLRGRAAYRLGDLTGAMAAFDEALAAASGPAERFAAAVQRARVAEMLGDFRAALGFWDAARAAAPREVEGWDGGARVRAVLGHGGEAAALLTGSSIAVQRVAGPRLAALLLARGETTRASAVLARLPWRLPAARTLAIGALLREGELPAAREAAVEVLADTRAGPWRDMAVNLLPPAAAGGPVAPASDPVRLARLAAERGPEVAAGALAAALAGDPAWARLLAGAPSEPAAWGGPAQILAAAGLERDAAALYAATFPAATPNDLAWSAERLAAWGNRPAALAAGERLWHRLGSPPAALLPAALQRLVLVPELVGPCREAARAAAVPAAWLVGIVRQESRFDEEASSPAGAVGVAQMVPEAARRLGAAPDDLRDSGLALRLAAREIARLTERFGPRLAVVAAAYNAGDRVVATWLDEMGGDPSAALFAAAVPYRETAGYVLAVCEGTELAGYLDGEAAGGSR